MTGLDRTLNLGVRQIAALIDGRGAGDQQADPAEREDEADVDAHRFADRENHRREAYQRPRWRRQRVCWGGPPCIRWGSGSAEAYE